MEKTSQRTNPAIVLILIAISTFVLILLLSLNYFKIISFDKILSTRFSQPGVAEDSSNGTKIIAKVGQENIYQKDLNSEMHNYPNLKNVDVKKILLDKIIKDSIILQAARADGIVKLDESVFNSIQKDYAKRMDLISAVIKKIDMNSDILTGDIVSLWFYNKGPGRVGYDKGREIALATITKLHEEVVNKKLTIQQAGQAIRNDPNLGYLDAAYLSNALLEFSKKPTEPVVFDSGFDMIIKKLKTGEVTDVYLAKSKEWISGGPTDNMIDSVYMFAQVTDKKKTNIAGFDEWVSQKAKSYAVIYY